MSELLEVILVEIFMIIVFSGAAYWAFHPKSMEERHKDSWLNQFITRSPEQRQKSRRTLRIFGLLHIGVVLLLTYLLIEDILILLSR